MKKAICFSLIVMFLALASSTILVKANVDVVAPYEDTATLTPEQITELTNTSLLIEYMRKGGTIDVKNTSSDYDFMDLISDFGDFVGEVIGDVVDLVNPFQSQFQWEGYHPVKVAEPSILQFMGLLPFYAVSQATDLPQPDPDYSSYITQINDTSFFWKDWPNPNSTYPTYYSLSPMSNMSYFRKTPYNDLNSLGFSNGIACSVQSIYIYSVPDTSNYSFTISVPIELVFDNISNEFTANTSRQMLTRGNPVTISPVFTYTGTLEDCFKYLRANVINVNIYVDGVPWAIVSTPQSFNIEISTGTTVPIKDGTGKVEWLYDYEIYFDMERIQEDLNTLLHYIKNNPNTPTIIKFDDIEDCIVDVNGQPAIAVKVLADTRNIDQIYIDNYGPIIPAFLPMFTPIIDDSDMIDIASTAVSPIPDDLLEVFGYMFMGVLFAGFIHRLLE